MYTIYNYIYNSLTHTHAHTRTHACTHTHTHTHNACTVESCYTYLTNYIIVDGLYTETLKRDKHMCTCTFNEVATNGDTVLYSLIKSHAMVYIHALYLCRKTGEEGE